MHLLVLSLTTPILYYMVPLKNISELQQAQNLLARIMTSSFQTHSHVLFQQLHWLPNKYHINFKISNITFRTLHSSQPAYLHSALHAHQSTRSLRLSRPNLLSFYLFTLHSAPAVLVLQFLKPGSLYLQLFECVPVMMTVLPSSQNSLFSAGLPISLAHSLLHLRFGSC